MVTLGETGDGPVPRDVNFACRIHPASQSDIVKQQRVTGFHNELSLCVKCCRMVDSVTMMATISILANTVRPSGNCRF